MIKRSPSRNHRSKGIKVKHVLQIILLLGVCFWLIYQVKRSHDKKKEFDENNASVSVGTQTAYQIQKLGRKDLHPGKDEVNQTEKHEEEVEDENIVEEDDENKHELHEQEEVQEGKEDSKHGVRGQEEAQEEEENKSEEMENERGGGDDEIDENDQEKSEVDTDRVEEFMGEEKEKEETDEKEKENSEDEEKEGSVENHNTHEAREEHYKGDDASSAVTHDTHTTSTETETISLENSDDNSGMNIMKSENKPNYTEKSSRNQTDSDIKVTGAELMTGWTSSNVTSGKETGNNSLSNPVDSLHLNSTTTTHSDSHSEASSNLPVAIPGASNNTTGTGAGTSSEQNKMGIFSESNRAQNNTVNTTVTGDVKNVQTEGIEQGSNRVSEENLPDSKATAPIRTENGDAAAAAGESAILDGGELGKTTRFITSNETGNKGNTETNETSKTQNNLYMKGNTDATDNEKLKHGTQTGEAGESSDSSTANGTTDSVDHNATDSSDSHILKDVTEVQTDPDTLPGIRNDGDNSDKTATA